MSRGNILNVIGTSVPGDGFRVQKPFTPGWFSLNGADANNTINNIGHIRFNASGEIATLNLTIPGDYDSASDELKVAFRIVYSSGTPQFNLATAYRLRGAATYASVTTPSTNYVISSAADNGLKVFDLSGLGHQPGDMLAIPLRQSDGSSTSYCVGGYFQYLANLALTTLADRNH